MDELGLALVEVDRFLNRHKRDYEQFVEAVFREVSHYRDLRKHSSPIYRIYGRSDKQLGREHIKSRYGIANKLVRWRREDKKAYRVNDIHDIVGVTVVTYFESELSLVCEALRGAHFDSFSVLREDEIRRADYNANHVIVRQRVKGFGFGGLLCEVQVKSLLHDSWSTRTHEIYKSRNLSESMSRRVSALSGLVKALEVESDLLRADLRDEDHDDDVRRDAAALALFSSLAHPAKKPANDGLSILSQKVLKERSYLADCPSDDPLLLRITEEWSEVRSSSDDYQTACRLITLLALLREARDFDNEALEAIDLWRAAASDPRDAARAMSVRTLANWALGYLEEAIASARELLDHAGQHSLRTETAKLNLAYYLAEQHFKSNGSTNNEQEIRGLIQQIDLGDDERQSMSCRDSLGAIKIMTARVRSDVYEGQRMCQDAQQWSENKPEEQALFQLFYELHERRAARRLAEL